MNEIEQVNSAETQPVKYPEGSLPIWLKRLVMTLGVILLIVGIPFSINLFCIVPLISLSSSGSDSVIYGVVSLTLASLTLGVGGLVFLQGNRSLQNKPSKVMQLPFPLLLVGTFIFLLGLGSIILVFDLAAGLFFPPILIACAALPPLWAVAWMIPQARNDPMEANAEQLSLNWRRALLSFAGGATVSVLIAAVLEILLPILILSLVFNLTDTVSASIRPVLRALSSAEVAQALTDPGFMLIFVQIAIVAPLCEELAKPLVVLPLLRHINKQQAFWVGAVAGAGFAGLENVIYASAGLTIWAGILTVRALGSALHPLGSGLVAQGWWSVLRGEKDSGKSWLQRFWIAVAVHAAWNGGSLLVITLGGARFFGELPADIDVLGLSAAGTTLAFLIVLGLSALWIGRAYGHDNPILSMQENAAPSTHFTLSDRAIVLWALACLAAIVPAGIAGLKLWLR